MTNSDALAVLGLARRAGVLAVGHAAVERAFRSGHLHCVVLAGDAGRSTQRKFRHRAQQAGVLCRELPATTVEVGEALGSKAVSVLGITDENFARMLDD